MSVLSGMRGGCASLQLDSWSWAQQPLLGDHFMALASTVLQSHGPEAGLTTVNLGFI